MEILHSQTAVAGTDAFTTASNRPLANFHPNIWGSSFLLHDFPETDGARKAQEESIEKLKEELRKELKELRMNRDYMGQVRMVDAIQRLGIAYHFELEIDQALQNVFETFDDFCIHNDDDMHAIALSFRLLRQNGYKVSSKIFEKFMDDGEFKVPPDHDIYSVMSMLEFYEATHLRFHDEDVLEYGFVSVKNYLERMPPNFSIPALAEQVDHALNGYSNRRGLPRLEGRFYLDNYAQQASHHQGLLRLAKLDFNWLQSSHKREASELYRWWKGLDVESKLPYIRDRMVETYFWILGIYFEPKYAVARKILSKVQAMASILDDTYDAYGIYEELKILTEAIERWDISSLDQLPEYMQLIYKALLELFREIENEEVIRQAGSYRIAYGKEAVKELARNYFEEIKWREEKYTPTTDEYMKLATKSCGYISLIIISFLGIDGDLAKREAFDWVLSQPDMVKATLIICRLTDDMVGHEFDRKRDHIPSAVECYMKEHNVAKGTAVDKFNVQIEDAWKDLNQGLLRPTAIPAPLLQRIFNFARIIEVIYKKGDWYTNVGPEMQSYIRQLLLDPVPE
uniref:Putative delta-cadinene synthase n=1 Tax=Scoparia dulcis TaxID=107240 RepID=A0A5K7Y0P5_SCODU|nr:putative delta-cadinene synthase [Scoparia dulcis]